MTLVTTHGTVHYHKKRPLRYCALTRSHELSTYTSCALGRALLLMSNAHGNDKPQLSSHPKLERPTARQVKPCFKLCLTLRSAKTLLPQAQPRAKLSLPRVAGGAGRHFVAIRVAKLRRTSSFVNLLPWQLVQMTCPATSKSLPAPLRCAHWLCSLAWHLRLRKHRRFP